MAYRMDRPKKLGGVMYQVYLVVRGHPLSMFDMMRYDFCVPATEDESTRMARAAFEDTEGTFVLRRLSPVASDAAHGRWRSFGCEVLGQYAEADTALGSVSRRAL